MKIHHISIAGYICGLGLIIASLLRYFVSYYDPSQAIAFTLVGALICVLAYIYNWMRENDKYHIDEKKLLEERLDRMQSQMDTIGEKKVLGNNDEGKREEMLGMGNPYSKNAALGIKIESDHKNKKTKTDKT